MLIFHFNFLILKNIDVRNFILLAVFIRRHDMYLKINDKHRKIIPMSVAKTFYTIMKNYIANNYVLAMIAFIKSLLKRKIQRSGL